MEKNKLDATMRRFASKVFEVHPEMMGLHICGVAQKKEYDKIGDLRVRGVYIENKNFEETKNE